jgi:hypothetical protein
MLGGIGIRYRRMRLKALVGDGTNGDGVLVAGREATGLGRRALLGRVL